MWDWIVGIFESQLGNQFFAGGLLLGLMGALAVWLREHDDAAVVSASGAAAYDPEDDDEPTFIARSSLEPPALPAGDDDNVPTRVAPQSLRPPSMRRQSAGSRSLPPKADAPSRRTVPPPADPPWVRVAIIALVLVTLLATAAAVAMVVRGRRAQSVAAREIWLSITGVPANAVVTLDGAPGSLPARVARGATVRVRIEAPGYLPWQQELSADGSVRLAFGGIASGPLGAVSATTSAAALVPPAASASASTPTSASASAHGLAPSSPPRRRPRRR